MSSFEFHVENTFASCQYHADEFFMVLDDVLGDFPLLNRARSSFENLNDDVFTFFDGETNNLHSEIKKISDKLSACHRETFNKLSACHRETKQTGNKLIPIENISAQSETDNPHKKTVTVTSKKMMQQQTQQLVRQCCL